MKLIIKMFLPLVLFMSGLYAVANLVADEVCAKFNYADALVTPLGEPYCVGSYEGRTYLQAISIWPTPWTRVVPWNTWRAKIWLFTPKWWDNNRLEPMRTRFPEL